MLGLRRRLMGRPDWAWGVDVRTGLVAVGAVSSDGEVLAWSVDAVQRASGSSNRLKPLNLVAPVASDHKPNCGCDAQVAAAVSQ